MSKHLKRADLAKTIKIDQRFVRNHPNVVGKALTGLATDYLGAKAVSFASSSPVDDLWCRQVGSESLLHVSGIQYVDCRYDCRIAFFAFSQTTLAEPLPRFSGGRFSATRSVVYVEDVLLVASPKSWHSWLVPMPSYH